MSGRRWLATQDHAAMMQCVGVDEIAVGRETRVVPVLDMRPVDLVAALIGSFALTAGLNVPSVRQEFMANTVVVGNPHASVWMARLQIALLCFYGLDRKGGRRDECCKCLSHGLTPLIVAVLGFETIAHSCVDVGSADVMVCRTVGVGHSDRGALLSTTC